MRKICTTVVLFVCLFTAQLPGQEKLAQTGFNFLSISSDAKSAGMGDAVNSLTGFAGALSHNPATMAEVPTFLNASFSVNSWIADINYTSASVIVAPFEGEYGVVGLGVQSVDYGELQGTMQWDNSDGYVETGMFKPAALAIGVGYASMISKQFGVGGQIRFAYQSLGTNVVSSGTGFVTKKNIASAVAYDFGTLYHTGIKSLSFGMSIRNFSKEVKFESEGFQLPLLFTIGVSANVFDFIKISEMDHALLLSIDATHPRSHPEELKIGAEYQAMKMISLRAGYVTAQSESGFSYGVGISSQGLGLSAANFEIDYSYTRFGIFIDVQRFTARILL